MTVIQRLGEKGWWLVLLLSRMVIGDYFIQTGLTKLRDLNHSKNILNFFWISVPAEHRWDPFFALVELLCGTCVLLGLLTRVAVVPLFGIFVAAILSPNLKKLAGLNLFFFQEIGVIILLVGLCLAGAGPISFDRFLFKHKSTDLKGSEA